MYTIGRSGRFVGRLSGPLLKTGLPLLKNVLKPLAQILLLRLGLTGVASATDAAIEKKLFGPGMITMIISNEEMNDIM